MSISPSAKRGEAKTGETRGLIDEAEALEMGKKIEISQATLLTLVLTLMVSLMGLAYLLGRQSVGTPSSTVSQTTTPPMNVAVTVPAGEPRPEGGIPSERLTPRQPPRPPLAHNTSAAPVVKVRAQSSQPRQSELQRDAPPSQPAVAPRAPTAPVKTKPSTVTQTAAPQPVVAPARNPEPVAKAPETNAKDSEAVREYLSQIDAAMLGTQALGDPNQFATELLGQSMQGDTSGFDSLIASTTATRDQVRAIQTPKACKEHHSMLMRQLDQSLSLLKNVRHATTSLDTGALSALSSQGRAMQADVARFQQLDQRLRKNS